MQPQAYSCIWKPHFGAYQCANCGTNRASRADPDKLPPCRDLIARREAARSEERDRVVKWLRGTNAAVPLASNLANLIEGGEHWEHWETKGE